jgi:hypothetical protein
MDFGYKDGVGSMLKKELILKSMPTFLHQPTTKRVNPTVTGFGVNFP